MARRSPSYSSSPKRGRYRSPTYSPSPRRGRYRSISYSPSPRRGNYRSPSYSPLRRRRGNPSYSPSQSYSPSPRRGRYRSQTYSPSPRRGRNRSVSYSPAVKSRHYRRRGSSPSPSVSPRGRYGGGHRKSTTSLLVRNLHRDCRPDDLRRPFKEFGLIKDVYLPRDYYTGEPRGFGFVQFFDPGNAADAKYYMDRQLILGREITVVFAEESRKTPYEMRFKQRGRSGHDYSSYERSYSGSRSPGRSYSISPRRRHYSRSVSPNDRRRRDSQCSSGSRSLSWSLSRNRCRTFEDHTSKGHKELSPSYSRSYTESSDRSEKHGFSKERCQQRSRSVSPVVNQY